MQVSCYNIIAGTSVVHESVLSVTTVATHFIFPLTYMYALHANVKPK